MKKSNEIVKIMNKNGIPVFYLMRELYPEKNGRFHTRDCYCKECTEKRENVHPRGCGCGECRGAG